MTTDGIEDEQLAIALMTMANRLFDMAGNFQDEHGFRNMGDQLAGWAQDLRGRATKPKTSAEQLAIALMAEARKFYSFGTVGMVNFQALADLLAGWASDVRQLGVDQLRHRESHKQQWEAAQKKLDQVRAAVRAVAQRWDHTAVSRQLEEALDD